MMTNKHSKPFVHFSRFSDDSGLMIMVTCHLLVNDYDDDYFIMLVMVIY